MESMEPIKTFVFFDVETTGLGSNEHSPTQFTELAFVAVMRDHLMATKKNDIPRALFKLVLPVNPRKIILPETTQITGLDNFMLEHMKKCDGQTLEMINSFLQQLIGPVCLIAHNGNNFDFKLLKRSLNQYNVSLRSDLLCADSLTIFKRIECDTSSDDVETNLDMTEIQRRNETTPSKFKYNRPRRLDNEKPSAARRLFDENVRNDEKPSTHHITAASFRKNAKPTQPLLKKSFKLTNIYLRMHGKEPEIAHNAEDDVITLMKCAIASKDKFFQAADQMSLLFSSY